MQAALSRAQQDQDRDLRRSGDPRVKGHASCRTSPGDVGRPGDVLIVTLLRFRKQWRPKSPIAVNRRDRYVLMKRKRKTRLPVLICLSRRRTASRCPSTRRQGGKTAAVSSEDQICVFCCLQESPSSCSSALRSCPHVQRAFRTSVRPASGSAGGTRTERTVPVCTT